MNIAFFGSSLVSAYWNGAATYYRGLLKQLHALGHKITFYEPDAYDRQAHRDLPDPEWARVVVYPVQDTSHVSRCLEEASSADVVIKASGVGVLDDWLESYVLALQDPRTRVLYWDVDAPATLSRVRSDPDDPLRTLIPRYDMVLVYGGGPRVIAEYEALGARLCVPIYNALDPETHYPVSPRHSYRAQLALLANRLPDREARIEEFFMKPARRLSSGRFVLAGSGWEEKLLPKCVRYLGFVSPADHNAFNCSPLAVLNVSRDSMVRYGYSPATRVFEAAGAGACLLTDTWEGLEMFLEPGREVLAAQDGAEVAEILTGLSERDARKIGEAARRRALAEHTYRHRALEVERLLEKELDLLSMSMLHAPGNTGK